MILGAGRSDTGLGSSTTTPIRETPAQAVGEYRPDIDGLRAFSILSVLLFHAWPRALPGGFVGVDIFFVISGFLISRIILASLADGSFRYTTFYGRRIRRIFPALLVVLVAFLGVGWAVLLEPDWYLMGKHVAGGAAFVSNLVSMREGDVGRGYFDLAITRSRPLLHLWSLGIEEQFYILWPLLLALTWRVRKALPAIGVVLAGSFVLNIVFIGSRPRDVFYFPATRFWELAAGAMLGNVDTFAPNAAILRFARRHEHALSVWGAILLVAAVVLIDERKRFPGAWALVPVTGAILTLAAGPRGSFNRWVLSSQPMVFLGLISYPLYLWHWPVLYFARILGPVYATNGMLAGAVAVSVALAWGTYRFVEKYVRHSPAATTPALLTVAMVVVAAVGLGVAQNRIGARLETGHHPGVATVKAATSDWDYPFGDNFLKDSGFRIGTVPGASGQQVLFIGDSHAEQYYNRVKTLTEQNTGLFPATLFATYGGCPSLPHLNRIDPGYSCDRFWDFAMTQAMDERVGTVVFACFWESYFGYENGGNQVSKVYRTGEKARTARSSLTLAEKAAADFGNSVRDLRATGKRVFIILSNPTSRYYDPVKMLSRLTGHLEARDVERKAIEGARPILDRLRTAAQENGAEVIDPVPALCRGDVCATTEDGQPIYKDTHHFRASVSARRAGYIDRIFATH